jgi:hypothetical protein
MLFYRAALPLSRQTLSFTAGLIRRHRAAIGSVWRKLNAGQQALLVLVHLRKGEPFAQVAAGFGVGTATAWRYVTETVALLAARAPKLRKAGSRSGQGFPSQSWTGPWSGRTGWRRTGRSSPASTTATG